MKLVVLTLLLAPLALPVGSADPIPVCTATDAAVPLPDGEWAYNAWTRIDFYNETNGVVGLQISPCTTVEGLGVPADTFLSSRFLPVCFNTPFGYTCIF